MNKKIKVLQFPAEFGDGWQGINVKMNESDVLEAWRLWFECVAEDCEPGDRIVITVKEMTEEEYDALPEI